MKIRFQEIIKSERGFGNPIESLIPVVLIGIVAAITIPAFVDMHEKGSGQVDLKCIKNMIAIAQESESTEATCPVSELEYEPIIEDNQVSVSCPDPEAHLLSSPLIIGSDKGLILLQTFPEITYIKSVSRDIADQTVLADLKKAVVVTEKMGWEDYLIVGLIILVLFSTLIRSGTALVFDKKPWKGLSIAFTWIIVCLIGGFFFHQSLIKSEYRFSKSDGTVSIHNRYAGEKFSDPEIFNDIVAVVPFRNGKERMSMAIFYETTEGIDHRKLFRVDNEKLEIVSLLNHAVFQGDTLIFRTVQQSEEQIETAEETNLPKEEKPGFFKTLKSLLSGKENKPQQRYPTFIPKLKVQKRQFKEKPWVDPDDDVYRRHQIPQENLIKGQMEALRMHQQQQEQMWRQQLQYDQLRNQQNYHQMR